MIITSFYKIKKSFVHIKNYCIFALANKRMTR